jgi:acetate CoA/acetoacetate CoA-transferase alpha subunit
MPKMIDAREAASMIPSASTVMIGGFMAAGTPESLVDAILEQEIGELTVITNDSGFPGVGVGKLIGAHRIKRLIASHIGTNPETGRQMNAGETEVTLLPQGSLVEKIRAGGADLGGILTPTGIGTVVAEGKSIIEVDGRLYILEKPLRANFALIYAHKADKAGNLTYHGSARNFNPIMALAADVVIAEVEELLEDDYLDPDQVITPGILVDYLVKKVS